MLLFGSQMQASHFYTTQTMQPYRVTLYLVVMLLDIEELHGIGACVNMISLFHMPARELVLSLNLFFFVHES